MENIYSINNFKFIDKIIFKKRIEILSIIKRMIDLKMINSCLDIGTTNDFNKKSSNLIIKNLNLLSKNELKKILGNFNNLVDFKIENLSLFGYVSNFIVIGKIK